MNKEETKQNENIVKMYPNLLLEKNLLQRNALGPLDFEAGPLPSVYSSSTRLAVPLLMLLLSLPFTQQQILPRSIVVVHRHFLCCRVGWKRTWLVAFRHSYDMWLLITHHNIFSHRSGALLFFIVIAYRSTAYVGPRQRIGC